MKRSGMFVLPLIVLITGVMLLTGCGGSGKGPAAASFSDSSHVTGPAPDNNSATNPSLADTNYERDKTRPMTDTMKKQDTIKKK